MPIRNKSEGFGTETALNQTELEWIRCTCWVKRNFMAPDDSRSPSIGTYYWTLALAVLLCCSLSVLTVAINRYFENPTYVALEDSKRILKPFPTVILCPEVKFPQYKINAFLESLKYPSDVNVSYIANVLPQLGAFFSPDVSFAIKDLEKIEHVLDYNNIDIESAGRQLTLSCSEAIIRCRWINTDLNCSDAFNMELTNYGFCCTFNGLSLRGEIKKYGIHSKQTKKKLYSSSLGIESGLTMVVNQSQTPRGSLDLSYKWLVLQSSEYADIIYNGTPISPGVESWAIFTSNVLHVSDDAESLGDELRHCRMKNDQLKYFPYYHKKFCILECEMERIRQLCNCVQVAHPYQEGLPICTTKHISCIKQSGVYLNGHDYCDCPPSCDTEIESVIVAASELIQHSHEFDKLYADLDFNNISVVRVFISSQDRKHFSRLSYFTAFQLFSQLGGVFNVFFGCSVLSLIELLQLVLHYCRDLYYQRQAKKLEKDKLNKKFNGILKL